MEHLTDEELEDLYEECLFEAYGVIEVCGYSYDAGSALKKLDPITFKVGLGLWIDLEVIDGNLVEKDGKYYRA